MLNNNRWDGSGFPEGLEGDAIPYEARIVAIADAYDRLIHPHNSATEPGLSPRQALEKIVAGASSKFDPQLVAAFRRITMRRRQPASSELEQAEASDQASE